MPERAQPCPMMKQRAKRFLIETAIRFRESGEKDWNDGTTKNISSSGVLFRADRILQIKSMLEMEIRFPPELTGGTTANVFCWGSIVRSDAESQAASILGYRFTHE